uniref:Uncharacterized protein n=1 Tax=Trichogramma kaykai TaxID=54128 RepID=A0ABD2WCF3_9HYME
MEYSYILERKSYYAFFEKFNLSKEINSTLKECLLVNRLQQLRGSEHQILQKVKETAPIRWIRRSSNHCSWFNNGSRNESFNNQKSIKKFGRVKACSNTVSAETTSRPNKRSQEGLLFLFHLYERARVFADNSSGAIHHSYAFAFAFVRCYSLI